MDKTAILVGGTDFGKGRPILAAKIGPAGPILAAKTGPAGPVLAGFSAKIGPAGPILGGTDFGVTELLLFNSSAPY